MKKWLLLIGTVIYTVAGMAQSRQVKGKVTDSAGVAIQSVNVQVKGTSEGTQTDKDGNFSITEAGSRKRALIFSAAGYKTIVITAAGVMTEVVMEKDYSALGEVVVTALGIKKKKSGLGTHYRR